jgi:hypothetical protein
MKIHFEKDADGLILFTLTPENDDDKTILSQWKELNYYTDIWVAKNGSVHIDIQ